VSEDASKTSMGSEGLAGTTHGRRAAGNGASASKDGGDLERVARMGLLARAPLTRLEPLVAALGLDLSYSWIRAPETGLAMVRGRMGGSGGAFNVGEVTVTRCALVLETGEVGHAYVRGRSHRHAELAALIDAAATCSGLADQVSTDVLEPLAKAEATARRERRAETEATRVTFSTLERERTP